MSFVWRSELVDGGRGQIYVVCTRWWWWHSQKYNSDIYILTIHTEMNGLFQSCRCCLLQPNIIMPALSFICNTGNTFNKRPSLKSLKYTGIVQKLSVSYQAGQQSQRHNSSFRLRKLIFKNLRNNKHRTEHVYGWGWSFIQILTLKNTTPASVRWLALLKFYQRNLSVGESPDGAKEGDYNQVELCRKVMATEIICIWGVYQQYIQSLEKLFLKFRLNFFHFVSWNPHFHCNQIY